MSFALTTEQFLDGSKTVTRRLRWEFLKTGDLIMGVKKGMGLKPGEKIERLGIINIISVRREPLYVINYSDVDAEGFPHMSPEEFIRMFCKHMKITPNTEITRIEFEHLGKADPSHG